MNKVIASLLYPWQQKWRVTARPSANEGGFLLHQ